MRHANHSLTTLAYDNNHHSKHTLDTASLTPTCSLCTRARGSRPARCALTARASGGAHADAAIVLVGTS
eukprot:7200041-Prymnesium_polylepis.1